MTRDRIGSARSRADRLASPRRPEESRREDALSSRASRTRGREERSGAEARRGQRAERSGAVRAIVADVVLSGRSHRVESSALRLRVRRTGALESESERKIRSVARIILHDATLRITDSLSTLLYCPIGAARSADWMRRDACRPPATGHSRRSRRARRPPHQRVRRTEMQADGGSLQRRATRCDATQRVSWSSSRHEKTPKHLLQMPKYTSPLLSTHSLITDSGHTQRSAPSRLVFSSLLFSACLMSHTAPLLLLQTHALA